jgi:voltage-gated potassium channel
MEIVDNSKVFYKNHIVLIGWDDFAEAVSIQLINAGKFIVVITNSEMDASIINDNYSENQLVAIYSEYENIKGIAKANIEESSNVFINLDGDKEKLIYIFKLRKKFKNIKIVAPISNPMLKETFVNAMGIHPLSKDEISAKMFASFLFEQDVAEFCSDLFSTAVTDDDSDIQQFLVKENNPYLQQSYGDAFISLKKKWNAILIGISKKKNDKRELLKNPPDDTIIELGDYLILIVTGKVAKNIEDLF